MKNICSKQSGILVVSSKPNFRYKFKKADSPLEVKEEHCEKILRNSNFYEAGKEQAKEVLVESTFSEDLQKINGIGEKTAKDIITLFNTREDLIERLKDNKELPFDDDVESKLREVFS